MNEPKEAADIALLQLVDEVDARGGERLRKAKQYSIDQLRSEGYPDHEIETLLNIKF